MRYVWTRVKVVAVFGCGIWFGFCALLPWERVERERTKKEKKKQGNVKSS
jgi:hypothetical protein